MNELEEVRKFVMGVSFAAHLPELEEYLTLAKGYAQRMGELANEAEQVFTVRRGVAIQQIMRDEELTETMRKQLLESAVAGEKKILSDYKLICHTLRMTIMGLMQAIKTRREEPH